MLREAEAFVVCQASASEQASADVQLPGACEEAPAAEQLHTAPEEAPGFQLLPEAEEVPGLHGSWLRCAYCLMRESQTLGN